MRIEYGKPGRASGAVGWMGLTGGSPRGAGAAFLLLVGFVFPEAVQGQIGRTFGVHMGQVRSRQIWSGPLETSPVSGLSLGVNVDVPTPARPFSIRAGFGYVRRGSAVRDPADEAGAKAAVRSHYLTIPIHGKLRFGFGPFQAHAFAGPVIEQLLETQCSSSLCRMYQEEAPTTLSLAVGLGLAVDVTERFRLEGEIQAVEGLSEAYRAGAEAVRYRSLELVFRVGFPV